MSEHPPNLPSITYTKVGIQKLRTAIWSGTDKGAGKRTPLLLFNGIGANLDIFQAFADHFTGRDIIAFDMPGIGGSPDPKVPYRPWWVAKAAKIGVLYSSATFAIAKTELLLENVIMADTLSPTTNLSSILTVRACSFLSSTTTRSMRSPF